MTTSEYYTTVEEQEMFRIAFPDIVAVFEDGRTTKTKERRQKRRWICVLALTLTCLGVLIDSYYK